MSRPLGPSASNSASTMGTVRQRLRLTPPDPATIAKLSGTHNMLHAGLYHFLGRLRITRPTNAGRIGCKLSDEREPDPSMMSASSPRSVWVRGPCGPKEVTPCACVADAARLGVAHD
jgi:hypothetical protein